MALDSDVHASFARELVGGAVERRDSLARGAFLDEFERRRPVVVRAASAWPAVVRWDPEHLIAVAGDARLELLDGVYSQRSRQERYTRLRKVSTTLAELVRSLLRGEDDRGYLFNTESGVFLVNERAPELRVGWARSINPELAPLAADVMLPEFASRDDLVYAGLLLGGPRHSGPLHYDLGGEARLLVQVRGKKHVLLFPPDQAGSLYLSSWFEDAPAVDQQPHASAVDLDRPDLGRFPALASARALEVVLEPGDVLYWPAFWLHSVRNLDPFTLAVSVAMEELRTTPMELREHLALLARLFRRMLAEEGASFDLSSVDGVLHALRRLEQRLLAEPNRARTTAWSWHHSVPT